MFYLRTLQPKLSSREIKIVLTPTECLVFNDKYFLPFSSYLFILFFIYVFYYIFPSLLNAYNIFLSISLIQKNLVYICS